MIAVNDIGNTRLTDYGIFREKSDIRAHVGVLNRSVFVYRTFEMIELLSFKKYPVGYAKQNGIITAKGFLVPVNDVLYLKTIKLKYGECWGAFRKKSYQMDETQKGGAAVQVVQYCMNNGFFPFWFEGEKIKNIEMDISGIDIFIRGKWRVQVKCDWKAGPYPGTGNLFIQTHECNPYKKY